MKIYSILNSVEASEAGSEAMQLRNKCFVMFESNGFRCLVINNLNAYLNYYTCN